MRDLGNLLFVVWNEFQPYNLIEPPALFGIVLMVGDVGSDHGDYLHQTNKLNLI